MKKRKNKVRMSIYIDSSLKQELFDLSLHTGISVSEFIRSACRNEIARRKKEGQL